MATTSNLKKWWQVYEGDEESRFFKALTRNKQYTKWRTASSLKREANISLKRTEEIINKYYAAGLIFQNPDNEEQWGYWENVAPDAASVRRLTMAESDQNRRVSEATLGKRPLVKKKKNG